MPRGVSITPRETGHRRQILDALAAGPILDPAGLAIQQLQQVTGHESSNSLSKILRRMEQQGLIRRTVKGRRTFLIEAAVPQMSEVPAEHEPDVPAVLEQGGVDIDLLAGVLLKKALMATQTQEVSAQAAEQLRHMSEQLRFSAVRTDDLEHQLAAARAEVSELKALVKTLEHNNKVLTTQMDKAKRSAGVPVKDMISAQERRDLEQLMRALPTR